jgi:cytochrome-b5 reductase
MFTQLRCKSADGSFVARPYTPVSKCNQRGSFQLLVKSYPQGVVSKYVGTLNVGDTVDVKGPLFKLKYTPNLRRQIGMIAGGTGIAPMLQVIKEILGNPMDKSNITLLFGNHEEGDILLRSELDALAAKHESQLTVHYVVSKPTQSWTGLKGIINEDMVRRLIPRPSPDVLVYVCGPPAMMEAVSGPKGANFTQGPVLGMLQRTGYTGEITLLTLLRFWLIFPSYISYFDFCLSETMVYKF